MRCHPAAEWFLVGTPGRLKTIEILTRSRSLLEWDLIWRETLREIAGWAAWRLGEPLGAHLTDRCRGTTHTNLPLVVRCLSAYVTTLLFAISTEYPLSIQLRIMKLSSRAVSCLQEKSPSTCSGLQTLFDKAGGPTA
jgi:hypothetical protein